jgi:hypothetical protein
MSTRTDDKILGRCRLVFVYNVQYYTAGIRRGVGDEPHRAAGIPTSTKRWNRPQLTCLEVAPSHVAGLHTAGAATTASALQVGRAGGGSTTTRASTGPAKG